MDSVSGSSSSGIESKIISENGREVLIQHILLKEDDQKLLLKLQKRVIEEVSNQMLELYEQNRVPPQGSEPEGQQPPTKVHADSGENVVSDGRLPSSGATSKVGSSKPVLSKAIVDADNHVGSARNDLRNSESHGNQHHEQKQMFHHIA